MLGGIGGRRRRGRQRMRRKEQIKMYHLFENAANYCEEAFGCEVFEETLESPLDCKEIQPVHPQGNQS